MQKKSEIFHNHISNESGFFTHNESKKRHEVIDSNWLDAREKIWIPYVSLRFQLNITLEIGAEIN